MALSNEELLELVEEEEVEEEVENEDDVVVEDTDEVDVDDDGDDDPEPDADDTDVDEDDDDDDDSEDDTEEDDESEEEDTEEEFVVTINGEEQTVTKEELLRGYQTNRAAQEKFREADAMRKQSEALIKKLQEDPANVLEQMGMDVRALAEGYLADVIAKSNMTEEQKKLMELQAERDRLAQMELDRRTEEARNEYVNRIETALKSRNIPNTEFTTQRMAYYMHEALSNDDPAIQGLSDEVIAELVEEDYANELRSLPTDKLEQLLGEETAKKIRKKDIEKVKGKKKPKVARSKKPVKKVKSKKEKETMTWDEYQEYLDSLT